MPYTMSEEEADDYNDYQRELAAERATLQIRKLQSNHYEVWSTDDGRSIAICRTRRAAEDFIKIRTSELDEERPNQEPQDERPGAIDHEVKF